MKKELHKDSFLGERLARYDNWLAKGRISYASKVIPVSEALKTKQWVLPTEQVARMLRKADTLAVQNCECRTHYKRCDHPLEICLLLNSAADMAVSKGQARPVGLDEAVAILAAANASGLVHLALYRPDHEIFALCGCCRCCCHDLQIVRVFERKDLMVRSEYAAVTDPGDCVHCGVCADRCIFGARMIRDEKLVYDPAACLGCGLCVTTCPVEAIRMERVSDPNGPA